MTRWKKAVSTAVTAAMLASLLATAVAPSAFAAVNILNSTTGINPATGVQADGISTVVIAATAAADPGANTVLVTTSAGTFVAVGTDGALGTFSLVTGQPQQVSGTIGAYAAADTITLRSPTSPATATINVYLIPTGGGNAVLDQTFTVNFYASGSTAVSAANTTVVVTGTGTTLKADGTETSTVTVTVKDGVSPTPNTITSGITVNASITPIGLIENNTVAGFAQVSADNATTYVFTVKGSGLAGTGVLALSVTTAATGASTTLPPVSFIFTGSLASLTLSNLQFSIDGNTAGNQVGVLKVVAKDAAGNLLDGQTAVASTIAAGSSVTALTVSGATGVAGGYTAGSGAAKIGATCDNVTPKYGTTSVSVKVGTVVSNAVNVVCADVGKTMTAAFDKTSVAPGGTATFSATVKDSGGNPVKDGTAVTAVTNSGAVVDPTDGNATAATSNGVATFTFIAPNSTGVATITGFETNSGSASASITVGAAAGTADSALGVTTSGPFSTTTKVQSVGGYVTFRFDFGAAAAGKTVTILSATKTGTTWSSFTTLTARVANSSGVVYYYVRQSSATWKSYRAQESSSGAITPARQARWT